MIDEFDEPPEAFYGALEVMMRESLSMLMNVEPDAQKFIEMYTRFAMTDFFEFFDYMDTGNPDEKRNVARMFAIQIWNNTPLPSNRYRPKPLTKPKRNEPCFCGSGKKYKQCCVRLEAGDIPIIAPEMMMHYLLEVISKTELKQVWQHLPHPLLGSIAVEWGQQSEELAERAVLMLDPIFKQEDAQLDHRDEVAFDALAELCTMLDKPRKKSALIKRIMQHSDKALCSAALHRQCCVLGDQGRDDEAWACFQKAQRLDPNNPALSHLEILLLMQQGKMEQVQQRGKYWIKRLGNMNHDGELDGLIEMIHEMISDAPTAMGNLIDNSVPGASRLIAWLKQACKKLQPLMNSVKVYDDVSIIEPINKSAARLQHEWHELTIERDDPWERPGPWLNLLETHPELSGSILVIDSLIRFTIELETPNPRVTFQPLLMLAMAQIKLQLPKEVKAPLEWAAMENRPALRTVGFLASIMTQMDDYPTAIEMMEWLLRLNPNDNQGERGRLINHYLRQHRDHEALQLCERYPDDMLVSTCFGQALAEFRLGRKKQADICLQEAIRRFPKIAHAVTRKTMKQPANLNPGLVTCGGDDEAWYYREDARELWVNTPGAIEWLKQCLKK